MKKKKLTLHRETLRNLSRSELGDVAGGTGSTWRCATESCTDIGCTRPRSWCLSCETRCDSECVC